MPLVVIPTQPKCFYANASGGSAGDVPRALLVELPSTKVPNSHHCPGWRLRGRGFSQGPASLRRGAANPVSPSACHPDSYWLSSVFKHLDPSTALPLPVKRSPNTDSVHAARVLASKTGGHGRMLRYQPGTSAEVNRLAGLVSSLPTNLESQWHCSAFLTGKRQPPRLRLGSCLIFKPRFRHLFRHSFPLRVSPHLPTAAVPCFVAPLAWSCY